MCGERRQGQREAGREHQLYENDNRKPHQIPPVRWMTIDDEKKNQNRQAQKEVDHVRENTDQWQHFGGEEQLLDEIAATNERAGRIGQRGREPVPGKNPAEHEERIWLHADDVVRHHRREHKGIDQQEQQRVDERPDESQHRTTVARLELARDQALYQAAVAYQAGEIGKQLRANSSATGDLQADQRLQHRDACALEVHVGRRFRKALFGALLRCLRAGEIDLVGLLGNLRQNGDAIRLDFCEAKRDQEIVLLLTLAVPQRAHLKRRQQRRVTWQDAEITVGTRNLDLVDLLPH